jgi:hypothetical protein
MKIHPILVAMFIAILLVALWSLYIVDKNHHKIEQNLEINALQDNADIALRTLNKLMSNDTNTVVYLQDELDTTVISLGKTLKEIPESQWDVNSIGILRRARDYYMRFPKSQLDPGLVEAFSLLARATNKP